MHPLHLLCRTLDHSTIVYESADARPLLRVQWNSLDPNYLATFAIDSNKVVVLDVRMPSVPAAELAEHEQAVVAMRWSPNSSSHILTSDDQVLRMWDLEKSPLPKWSFDALSLNRAEQPTPSMLDPVPIQQVLWPAVTPDWIALTSSDQVSVLQL